MALTKRFLKDNATCKVTFKIPVDLGKTAAKAVVVGDFNNWDRQSTAMKKCKDGSFTLTLNIPTGRDYEFRYLLDDAQWENEWNADRYMFNPYGNCDNSVLSL